MYVLKKITVILDNDFHCAKFKASCPSTSFRKKKRQRLSWAGIRFKRGSASNRENYLNILIKIGL